MRWQINGFMFPELATAQPVPRVLGHLRGHQPLTGTAVEPLGGLGLSEVLRPPGGTPRWGHLVALI